MKLTKFKTTGHYHSTCGRFTLKKKTHPKGRPWRLYLGKSWCKDYVTVKDAQADLPRILDMAMGDLRIVRQA